MTEHDKEFEALARRIKHLRPGVEPSSRLMDYVPLTFVVSCLLIFDTETWLQHLLLLFLTAMGAFLLWFGQKKLAPSVKANKARLGRPKQDAAACQ